MIVTDWQTARCFAGDAPGGVITKALGLAGITDHGRVRAPTPAGCGQHLVITGPAGAGKSSLLRHIAGSIATGWLSHEEQARLPILIHARDLAAARPLAEALHAGATRTLAANLRQSLPEGFFDGTPLPQKR